MRLKLLNGAPLREHLDYSDETLVAANECGRFVFQNPHGRSTEESTSLKWRDIGLKSAPLRTGWSQPYLPGTANDSQSFVIPGLEESSALPEYDASDLDNTLTFDEDISAADGYLEHSLVFYDTLMSSQVVQDAAAADNTVTSSSFLTTSFGTTASGFSSPSPVDSQVLVLQVPTAMAVTPLGSLPSARHLRSIYPQTPTPNFLCALMTTPERREVFVRKGGYNMDLWEIIVGDDTCSNFKVTFWLRPPRESNNEQNHMQSELLHTLERLQVGNIILLRNIALTSFRDVVYGQSLNTAITRARTSIDVLIRSGGLPASAVEAFMRVKRWARAHVASGTAVSAKRKAGPSEFNDTAKRVWSSSGADDDLPPDTMEAV